MRKIYNLFVFMVAGIFVLSCKKEDKLEIATLSKAGEEFYFGEKVVVWTGTAGGDKNDISYQWTCTGGRFDGWRTQNLFENLWIAPAKAGDYTVTATAKSGGKSSSRSANMKVTKYFFDEFQSKFTFDGNGWSVSDVTGQTTTIDADPLKSYAEITANTTKSAIIKRNLDLAELKIPFSVRTRLGWKTFFRAGQAITISIFFKQPSANLNYPYLREIRWEYWPTVNPGTTDNYQIRYETFIPASNTSKFSTVGNALPLPQPLISPVKGRNPAFQAGAGVEKSLSFAVDANNVFSTYIDGVLWFQSNGIKDWLAYCKANYPGFEDPVGKSFQVAYPAKANNNEAGTVGFLNSVFIYNDG
ncbi:hypothetical protein, partial [Pedobacter sp. HMWF019]|uniref:hypothetical protein n=1 Tax=Pedobacter sp. HMWF019 TaxID=2056856 RepID=UPI0011B259AD